jgi:hypothetical protein
VFSIGKYAFQKKKPSAGADGTMPFFGGGEAVLMMELPKRDDAGIGHTARPLPIAVADLPIEAASPDPQQPMCFLE